MMQKRTNNSEILILGSRVRRMAMGRSRFMTDFATYSGN